MGYFYNDDDEFNDAHRSFSVPVMGTIIAVSVIVLVILLLVFASNNSTSGHRNRANAEMMAKETPTPKVTAVDVAKSYTDVYGNKDIEGLYNDKKLRAEDFDFWDMYKNEDNVVTVEATPTPESSPKPEETPSPDSSSTPTPSPSPSEENEKKDEAEEEDELLEGVRTNSIDFTSLKQVNDKMEYYLNGNKVSKLGIIISKESGVVDYSVLKDQGIDFVMLKVGGRGYDSGVINMEDNFERNLRGASEAGLGIGLYFSSRAVTVAEATEEADYCMSQVGDTKINYPIGFSFDGEMFDEARTDILDQEDRTRMAESFLREVESQGYVPVIYGSEDYILEDIIPDKLLQRYDVMLNDTSSIPKYPYFFKLWNYKNNLSIQGVEGMTGYVISFVDYSSR